MIKLFGQAVDAIGLDLEAAVIPSRCHGQQIAERLVVGEAIAAISHAGCDACTTCTAYISD